MPYDIAGNLTETHRNPEVRDSRTGCAAYRVSVDPSLTHDNIHTVRMTPAPYATPGILAANFFVSINKVQNSKSFEQMLLEQKVI